MAARYVPEFIELGAGMFFSAKFGEIRPSSLHNLMTAIARLDLHGVKPELANAIIEECYGFTPKPSIWELYFKSREIWGQNTLRDAKRRKIVKAAEVSP